MRILFTAILIISTLGAVAQKNDSLPYKLYKDRLIVYSDIGFKEAPFSITDNFADSTVSKLNYGHNLSTIIGVGFAYKWLGLRIGFNIPGYVKQVKRFGQSSIRDLGVRFNFKATFWDIDYKQYSGYAIVNAFNYNDTLDEATPNDIRPITTAKSFSINSWYFLAPKYRMQPVLGIAGEYTSSKGTWYLKTSMNVFGVNNGARPIVPTELIDTVDRSKASVLGAFDFGIIPGYAYTHRKNHWQTSIFAGIGGVLQAKWYSLPDKQRTFVGIAPRVDLRFLTGYSRPSFFFYFVTDFDIKSIRYQEMQYDQWFYNVQLSAGYRLKPFKKKNKKSKRKD